MAGVSSIERLTLLVGSAFGPDDSMGFGRISAARNDGLCDPGYVFAGVAPSGVVTFLFTDIEGSTRRWESDADAMRADLAVHDEVLRSAIDSHDGYLFKTTGDGVVAAFASPRSAVEAALAAQLALALPVRMGLATGEAQLRDGDYFGAVLNRAARVMAAGHGGQVLVADSTAALLKGVDLINLGSRWLRDVPDPITVFQLRSPDLQAEFPPLKTLPLNQGNLRPQTSSFIGRGSAVVELEAAVRTHRLVTLTGVGGVGKTRLALEIASQLSNEFPDGVWVFELAAVVDAAAVPDAVAAVLGITQQPGKSVTDSIADALEGRNRLLVFDNCEHVLDAVADLLDAILGRSATLTILATSREGVGVADEQLWPVRALDIEAAVDLFVERARRVAPAFAIDDPAAVAQICERLDGIPLAIELAASRVSSMGVEEIGRRLEHRFRFLTGSRRGAERHQTLRQAVAWSYDLLDTSAKALLERCSVFCGGFDLESACAVAGLDEDDYTVLDQLDALVRKSLLVADRSGSGTRFSMLETIRQFAHDRLVEHGAEAETHGAHARLFAGCEEKVVAVWDSPRQRDAYTWFETEFANLRAAFRWSADNGDLDTTIAVACCAGFFGTWLELYEPVAWVEEVLETARAAGHRRLPQLYVAAAQCYAAGRTDDAARYLDASFDTVELADFDAVPFGSQISTGFVYSAAGQPQRWVDACRRVIDNPAEVQLVARASLAMALRVTHSDESAAAAEGLLAAAESADNPNRAAYALLAYGLAHGDTSPAAAHDAWGRAFTIAQNSGNRQMESALAAMLCTMAATADHLPLGVSKNGSLNAIDYLTVAIRRYHDAGSITLLYFPLGMLAVIFDNLGEYEQAAIVSGFAVNTATALPPKILATVTHLRAVLGDQMYESFAGTGERMTPAEMVTYAFDQIDLARTSVASAER